MSEHNLENKFRQTLLPHQPEWDKAALWDELEHELDKKPKRRLAIWWWIGTTAVVLLIGSLIFNTINFDNTAPLTDNTAPITQEKTPATDISNKDESINVSEKKGIDFQKKNKVTNTNSKKKINSEKEKNTQSVSQIIFENNLKNKTKIPPKKSNKKTNSTETNSRFNLIKKNTSKKHLSKIPNLTISEIRLNKNKKPQLPALIIDLNNNKIRPLKKWKKSIVFSMNAFIPQRHFTGSADLADHLLKKEEQEKTLHGFGGGLSFQLEHQKGILAAAGIDFQQVNERLKWKQVLSIEELRERKDSAFYYPTQAGLTFITDTLNGIETTFRQVVHHNQHRFFNLHLHGGFQKNIGRYKIGILTGPVVQLHRSFHGRTTNTNNNLTGEGTSNKINIDNKIGIGMDVIGFISFNINSRNALAIKTNYRKSPNMRFNGFNYSQRYDNWGIQFSFKRNLVK